jgi:hypothetical protein
VSLFFLAPSRRPLGNSECGPSPAASKTIRRPLPDRERQSVPSSDLRIFLCVIPTGVLGVEGPRLPAACTGPSPQKGKL